MLNHGLALLHSFATHRLTTEREKQHACTRSKKPGGWTAKLGASCALLLSHVLFIRPFNCFSFSCHQTPIGKEMSAHKLSHLAWLEEKPSVAFYQGHNSMYWASHTDSKFPLYTCSSSSVSYALCWKFSANCLILHASSSLTMYTAGPDTSQPDTSDAWLHRDVMTWWMLPNNVLNLVLLEGIFLWLVSRLFSQSYNLPHLPHNLMWYLVSPGRRIQPYFCCLFAHSQFHVYRVGPKYPSATL